MSPEEVTRACFEAYVRSDKEAIEGLLAENFRFTSPMDNGIGREAYFAFCWPNHENIEGFVFEHLAVDGEWVFVTYVCHLNDGSRLRNTEVFRVIDDRIAEVEVYFGWRLPHDALEGRHIDRLP